MEKETDLLLQIYIYPEEYVLYQQWPREKSLRAYHYFRHITSHLQSDGLYL